MLLKPNDNHAWQIGQNEKKYFLFFLMTGIKFGNFSVEMHHVHLPPCRFFLLNYTRI